jgi:hypothetical protein
VCRRSARSTRTNADIAAAITAATGEEISSTGFWKLRTGKGLNPTLRTLVSFAQFIKVPVGFFSDDPEEAEAAGDQLALLVMLRDKGVTGGSYEGWRAYRATAAG